MTKKDTAPKKVAEKKKSPLAEVIKAYEEQARNPKKIEAKKAELKAKSK